MQLRVLGSGTIFPHPRRGASGYACIAPTGEVLLLECGPGSTRVWPRHGIALERVVGIAITHHHVDHCSDLAPVLFARNVVEPPLATSLALLGPRGHGELVAGLERIYGSGVHDTTESRALVELSDGDRAIVGPFTIEAREMFHVAGALGLRVTCGGRTLAFSGDTGACTALVELCRDSDVALLECSYPASRPTTRHLNTRTAGEMARDAGVGRLVLTHFYASCDDVDVAAEVRAAGYANELRLAEDGDVIEV